MVLTQSTRLAPQGTKFLFRIFLNQSDQAGEELIGVEGGELVDCLGSPISALLAKAYAPKKVAQHLLPRALHPAAACKIHVQGVALTPHDEAAEPDADVLGAPPSRSTKTAVAGNSSTLSSSTGATKPGA